MANKTCKWTQDDPEVFLYFTECDNGYWFDWDDLRESDFDYCPYCGGKIVEVSDEADEQTKALTSIDKLVENTTDLVEEVKALKEQTKIVSRSSENRGLDDMSKYILSLWENKDA